MRTLLRKFGLLFILGIVALALSIPTFAGSQTGYTGTIAAGGIDFTATLVTNSSNDTFTLDFTGKNTNLTTSTLNAYALQLFCCGSNGTFDLTNSSLPLNWTTEAGAKINNSGGLGCNASNGAAGWLCATAQSNSDLLMIAAGQKFDMTFSGTYSNGTTVNSFFDLMANGLTNANDDHSKWSISQSFDWTEFTPIPEPGSLATIGSGLLTFGILLRKKLFV
jgi:hypothetical protein